jgi:hypothetical protein
MTPAELRTLIETRAAGDAPFAELVAARADEAIAAALSENRTRVVQTYGGYGHVMETLGATDGAALLNALEALAPTQAPIKWAFKLLERGVLDFGSASTRAQLDALVTATVLSAPVAAALKATAEAPDPIHYSAVAAALSGA